MKSRLATLLLVAGIVVLAASVAYAGASSTGLLKSSHHARGHNAAKHKAKKHKAKHHRRHHGAKHSTHAGSQGWTAADGDEGSAAGSQYGTRPGKGCGDTNHTHTGPPGNPSNTSCPNHPRH
jgi:hypothetical protein